MMMMMMMMMIMIMITIMIMIIKKSFFIKHSPFIELCLHTDLSVTNTIAYH